MDSTLLDLPHVSIVPPCLWCGVCHATQAQQIMQAVVLSKELEFPMPFRSFRASMIPVDCIVCCIAYAAAPALPL